MGYLPGLLLIVMLQVCLGVGTEPVSGSVTITGSTPKCPGGCQKTGMCITVLEETDCPINFECCVDHMEKVATTEFADDFTTESVLDSSEPAMEQLDDEVSSDKEFSESGLYVTESEEGLDYSSAADIESANNDQYEVIYSEEDGDTVLGAVPENLNKCMGTCVPLHISEDCYYIVEESDCPPRFVCCLSVEEVKETESSYIYEESSNQYVKRDVEQAQYQSRNNCPASCVHPTHISYCREILDQYACPLNSKCCITNAQSPIPEPTECKGQCLAYRMSGYCLPPNEIILGPTTCPPNQVCCASKFPSDTQPPLYRVMAYPSVPEPEIIHEDSKVLAHLAVDDSGNVFKVSKSGEVTPLVRLPLNSNLKELNQLGTYSRFDGEINIYSDAIGNLFQQFVPRNRIPTPQTKMQTPLIRQPIHQFESQASEQAANLQAEGTPETESSDDIVIPEDDDEAPVNLNLAPSHADKSSRPPCPGSCMSYFLRFTCFRGYAIYDGFTCPGRSVCCAKLKDIEDHEQYLKSLSPYFNVPPASRDPSLPRCGIKGRRDTPRVMGGKESLPGEWCWQVAVINVHNQYICGGALIDGSWVLTAAHCVSGQIKENRALFVRAGVTDLKSPEDNNKGQTIRVLSSFIHHNFNSLNLDNNIALLRLQKPLNLSSNVCVVCLPTSRKMPKENSKCTITGYGFVSADGQMSLRIKEAKVPIIEDMECMTNVTEALDSPFILPASSFCAGGQGLEDACQGDAGGALVCETGGFHEMVGLVSWGLGCGKEHVPSIYVKVPAFMGWINQIISSSSFLDSLS